MQVKLLIFPLNMKKLIKRIVCNHVVAMDHLYIYMYKQPVATRWLQTTRFINFYICKRKATSNLSPFIRLINNDILISNYAKFLGVIIDKNLTWYDHIHYISGKISKGVGILSKLKYILPIIILKLIYNAIISPYITYCNIVWGGTYSNRLNSICVLQNRAIRIISGNDQSLHTPQLY